MKFEDVLHNIDEIQNENVIGIDIGSRQAKGVLLYNHQIFTTVIPTGYFMQETADTLIDELLNKAGIERKQIYYIVITGYGRIAVTFTDIPFQVVTEIACHGRGAHFMADDIHTIIDIGGQDSKAIRIDPANGNVANFAMNDKCAAGTGRFLERIANVLSYDVNEMGPASLKADSPAKIDSTCVVFAESEVISSRAKGISSENLAAGIHKSVAKRVYGLLNRVGIEPGILFTGGVSNNVGMRKAFEDLLGINICESEINTVFAGALGAATFAADFASKNYPSKSEEASNSSSLDFTLDLSKLKNLIEKAKEQYEKKTSGKSNYVAYTCSYVPIEILGAADVAFMRLPHKGNADELMAGEAITQSMLCDSTKSLLGGFQKKDKLFTSVEKLYSFYTCGCMKSAIDAVNELFVPSAIFNLPRNTANESAKEYYATEIESFKTDLEKLTGKTIDLADINRSIHDYNLARKELLAISEFRKDKYPLIKSSEYQQLVHAYFSTPVKDLLPVLSDIRKQLEAAPKPAKKKIRLLLSGGIVTEGDNKVTDILESLGAAIVAEDNCTGVKPLDFAVDEQNQKSPYLRLADSYFAKAPCSRMCPKEDMIQYSLKMAKDYDVDGVVLYYLKFCPCYSLVEKRYREVFRENNIPLIIVSGDYSTGDEGQIKTRLEAFIELLQQRKGDYYA